MTQKSKSVFLAELHPIEGDLRRDDLHRSQSPQQELEGRIRQSESIDGAANIAPSSAQILSPRYSEFVGRSSELKRMRQYLLEAPKTQRDKIRTCVLCGMPGVGKSETAVEYAHANKQDYPISWVINAEDESKRIQSFCQLAQELGFMAYDAVGSQKDIDNTRRWLEGISQPWLLIFDNVEDYKDINLFLPVTAVIGGSVIIATQSLQIATKNMENIEIESFDIEDGADLLLTHVGLQGDVSPEKTAAQQISHLVGGLPLVIAMIGGFVKQAELSLDQFLKTFEKSPMPLDGRGARSAWRYDKTPQAVFDIALANLSADASRLLEILAFLDADAITDDILVADHKDPSLEFLRPVETVPSMKYFKMAYDLRDRILVKREKGVHQFKIHRSVQQAVRYKLTKDEHIQSLKAAFHQAFLIVRRASPDPSPIQVPPPSLWNAYQKVLPHILALESAGRTTKLELTVEFARLISDAGINMWERGLVSDGLRLLRSAESVLDEADRAGKENLLRASIHVVVSLMIQFYGISHRQESRDRMTKAVETRLTHKRRTKEEEYTRNDDILLCNAESDHACTILQFNDYKIAEQIFDQCVNKYKTWGRPDAIPFEYAKYNHHKGHCQMYLGKFAEAIEFVSEGWRLMTLATGKESSMSYRYRFDLACVVLQSGDVARALEIYREVLDGQEQGAFGFLTLQSLYAVGAMHDYLGNSLEAEKNMRTALGRAVKAAWPECAVARAKFHLSLVLKKLGPSKYEEQIELETQARAILERLLPNNPLASVDPEDELALFDHLHGVFDGRFTSMCLLKYLSQRS